MDFSFYLIFLISGYMFSSTWKGSSFHIELASGTPFYFRVGFYAIFVFCISTLLHLLISVIWGHYQAWTSGTYTQIDFTFIPNDEGKLGDINTYLLCTMGFAILIGSFGGPILDKLLSIFIPGIDYVFLSLAVENNDFEKLLLESLVNKETISITTANHKVYIGYLSEGLNPWVTRNNLKILPVISGHRRKKDQRFKFTTFYQEIYNEIIQEIKTSTANKLGITIEEQITSDFTNIVNKKIDEQINRFEIVIPVREIQSLNKFDLKFYEKFAKRKPKESKSSSQLTQ